MVLFSGGELVRGGRVVAGAVRLVGEFMEAVPHGGLRKMVFLDGQ